MDRDGCYTVIACVIVGIVILVIVFGIFVLEAFIIRLGWNYVLVDSLKVSSVYMTWKAALITTLCLAVIGGMFRGVSTSKD